VADTVSPDQAQLSKRRGTGNSANPMWGGLTFISRTGRGTADAVASYPLMRPPAETGAADGAASRDLNPATAPGAWEEAWSFELDVRARGAVVEITVRADDAEERRSCSTHRLDPGRHQSYLDLFADLGRRYGTRPAGRAAAAPRTADPAVRPVLDQNLSSRILYGYGDPAVTRVEAADGSTRWWLYVTSNDAPDAFPILSSDDLESWRLEGFVFPQGATPEWAMTRAGQADFWAPEMHRIGGDFVVCFAARERSGDLAVGLARASAPEGPFAAGETPLIRGGVIDPHIVADPEGAPYLVWKEDANDRWPRLTAALLDRDPTLVARLFSSKRDRRAAALCSRLVELSPDAGPMETFFMLQPLIEAAADNFPGFRARLAELGGDATLDGDQRRLAEAARLATRTAIRAQRLTDDLAALTGESRVILENDLAWEAHLVEGPWISRIGGRYVLFYAGNDFSTDRYGIGVAVADHPLGPYRKAAEPLLQSTEAWLAPGHPSVTLDAEGQPRMFLHAFPPGRVGYKVFRALLTAPLVDENGGVRLGS